VIVFGLAGLLAWSLVPRPEEKARAGKP
jgi:hypothetical protein